VYNTRPANEIVTKIRRSPCPFSNAPGHRFKFFLLTVP
jgi:hypothetical protein